MKSRKQQMVDDLVVILQMRLVTSRQLYPRDGHLQHMDQMGYLIGIITDLALADSHVENQLYRILRHRQDQLTRRETPLLGSGKR